jgi:hypothetical protein
MLKSIPQETESSSVENVLPSWAKESIDKACSSSQWKNLLENVYLSIQTKCKYQNIMSFANLTQKEQAALIEREFYDMQQGKDSMLVDFSSCLNACVDDGLVEMLSSGGGQRQGSVERLSEGTASNYKTI